MSSNTLLRFYSPIHPTPDARGRTLSTILSWPDRQLEFCHDYIQTIFPLPEPSPYNYSAPVIDREVFEAFRSRPEIRLQMRKSLERMLKFYGFVFKGEEVVIGEPWGRFCQRQWVRGRDHNHLRITRILRSLRVLGLEAEAQASFDALFSVYEKLKREGPRERMIGDTSLKFWTRAAKRPLFLAPEEEEDRGRGRKFLYEFERNKAMKDDGSETDTDEASSTTDDDKAQGQDQTPEKSQTSKVPAIPNGEASSTTNGFSNQDPSKASHIQASAQGSKRKFEGPEEEST